MLAPATARAQNPNQMEKHYNVFISSTFRDLREERQAAIEAVLELGHFPTAMEVFPASDSAPWELIERVISETDYFVLIVGGRYGSTDSDGVSYTEKEYDLAARNGIPVLAFLHGVPDAIPASKVDMDPSSRMKLEEFRKKVQRHLCKEWKTADELKAQIVVGLIHSIRLTPRVGWIRADQVDSAETLRKLSDLFEENRQLKENLDTFKAAFATRNEFDDLAHGDDQFQIHYLIPNNTEQVLLMTWDRIFQLIGPKMMTEISSTSAFFLLQEQIKEQDLLSNPDHADLVEDKSRYSIELSETDFEQIMTQLMALDLVEPITIHNKSETIGRIFSRREKGFKLTRQGSRKLALLGALRTQSSS